MAIEAEESLTNEISQQAAIIEKLKNQLSTAILNTEVCDNCASYTSTISELNNSIQIKNLEQSEQKLLVSTLRNKIQKLNEEISNLKSNISSDQFHNLPITSVNEPTDTLVRLCTNQSAEISAQSTNNVKNKVLVLADSHGRDFGSLFYQFEGNHNNNNICMDTIFKPNATLEGIVCDIESLTKNFNFNDCVVIFGGTNNFINSSKSYMIYKTAKSLRFKIRHTNVIFCAIPYNNKYPTLNKEISKFNYFLNNLCEKQLNFTFYDPNLYINSKLYSSDMLHINKKGKKIILKNIMYIFGKILETNRDDIIYKIPTIISNTTVNENFHKTKLKIKIG